MSEQINPLWERDDIQFPRLLAEIAATIELTGSQWSSLYESMDISSDDLDELFSRAQAAWEKHKQELLV
jgi:hypothetical protein